MSGSGGKWSKLTLMDIRIESEKAGIIRAELDPALAPKTVEAIVRALPIEAHAKRWGDEVYFSIAVHVELENPRETVAVGDLAYWPPGQALCIFFGPTPASRHAGEIRPASPVTPVGRVVGDPQRLARISEGDRIIVRPA